MKYKLKFYVRNRGLENLRLNISHRTRHSVLALFLALVGTSCGYHFSGSGDGLPEDIRSVFVAPFVNRTRDVSIEREITSALRSELHRRGRIRVVDRLEDADAIISGVVRSLNTKTIAVNREDEALQFETEIVVDTNLRRPSSGEVLWRTRGNRFVEIYSGSRGAVVTTSSDFKTGTLNASDVRDFTDIQLTETLGSKARERLVEKSAHELHLRLMEMF